ncbi:TPA: hypothetical protein I7108_003909 [Vibrio cholerae O1]|uniref:hypothetical protein n=1 Tax=Vibrio TaxID=662 RepID=UPI00049A0637|nr:MULTISPECIES: hypothetical protein [Vibrio]HAS2380065.1 hypothetical protein [Vibrio cholerae O1]EGQ8225164.1 hypothetical protein [Vibrio cholerae]EGR4075036.1 hypothetical protein [Vibrio cholerae]EJL6481761.1 hypothetical protein [Vibrio cholerae]EJL6492211.1 hypothetical protein [Vibrio cholerae]
MEKFGILLTSLWFLLLCGLVALKWDDAVSMSLNEWGDFLAGVTAPIAFLWLIIGYMLQRKELSLNSEALWLTQKEVERQANELEKQSGYQSTQAKLASAQYRKIKFDRLKERRQTMFSLSSVRENDESAKESN